jgi:serralysin
MADIKLTSGDDRFTQSEANKDNWENYFGLDGNDTFKIYQGTVIGGAGNDTIERNPTGEWWRGVQAAYWDSPTGARVDLEAGTADDGWGGRDTLIGVDSVSGSGNDDWFKGNANDNQFWPNNGNDTVFGGAGIDRVTLPWFEPVPGQPWRPTHLEDLDIVVSVDGRSATLRPLQGKGFSYTLTDVETIEVETGAYFSNTYQTYSLADFIESQDMAEQAIAAGGGWRWNASQPLGSATALTYSFVTQAPTGGVGAAGFRTFSAAERQAVRDIFAETSALTGLSFSEVTETAGATGQLRFGVSQQRDTRGVSWLPNQSGAGESAGDVWMDVESMLNLAVGSEGYAALLHEIGHALGLRHPRNVDPGDAWAVQLRESDDRSALTVMSDAYSADGLFRSDWGPLDVLALRYLYGTREHQAGDDQYRLGAHQASGQTTLVDDGGEDTLDASQLTSGVNLDLAAGHLSSVGVTGAGFNGVENLGLTIGSEIEHAIGSAFDDVLLGNALDNVLSGGTGNDWIEGEEGEDTAHFAGPRSEYRVSSAYGKVFVEARDGVSGYDTLSSIERLSFGDQSLAVAASPLGADVDFSVDEDKVFTASLPDPSDVGRGEVSYRLAAAPAHGTATITADGSLHYEPQADFWGVDTLSFEMVGAGSSNQYLSFVEVRPINDAGPVGANATFLTATGALFKARLPEASDLDDDPLTYSVAVAPKGGVVTIVGGSQFVYQSRAGFSGPDSFTYSVSDGMGGSSSYTATINLASVTGQQVGSAGNDTLLAAASADGYMLLEGNDRATGGGGNDLIDGGDGIDTSVYVGSQSRYRLEKSTTHWTLTDRTDVEGVDKLVNVERLQFSNLSLALDLDGNAGVVAKILRAVFGASALQNEQYAGIGLQLVDSGVSTADLVEMAMAAGGVRSNRDVVNLLYKNVTGVQPTLQELNGLASLLDSGAYTQSSLALLAVEHPWNTTSADLVGLASTGLEFIAPAG